MAPKSKKRKPEIVVPDDEPAVVIPGQRADAAEAPPSPADHLPSELPVLPIRDTVAFPGTILPLAIQRESSSALLADVLPDQKIILAVAQKDADQDEPAGDDLYQVGTAMLVLKLLRMEDQRQNLIVQGVARMRVRRWTASSPYLRARVERLHDTVEHTPQADALLHSVRTQARRVIELTPGIPDEALVVLNNIEDAGPLGDFVASNLNMELPSKQEILEALDVGARLRLVSVQLQKQIQILELANKIQTQVRESIDKRQREYFLEEQLKAIRRELGQADEGEELAAEYDEKIAAAGMPDAVEAEARRELDRLSKVPSASPEHNIIRTYLDVMIELPWSTSTEDHLDVAHAKTILDEDHYDLDKVKRRILEFLAVRKLAPDSPGPILCFAGPPGVGKTSLGQSIARAMGREFIRMSLGGMHDEAELRGHRRTYIGAMPGRIIQEMRKAGTNNPVFMLDEVDKLGQDFRGDPTNALLEVLDPAQNNSFQDHYLNVPFDLSRVLFIATANYIDNIPTPLRDRMEVIRLAGYTRADKLQIARRYLVARQLKANGLTASKLRFSDTVLRKIIEDYTREAGVRELERQIGSVCRGVAARVAAGTWKKRTAANGLVEDLLGPRKYESELAQRTNAPGVVTGLAYTPVGGTILFIEATMYPGKGQLILTGHIGDVMRESAQAALSIVKARATLEGMDMDQLGRQDIHIHVPAGAVPKDGPSAGVAMFTALMSLLTNRAVRPEVAMTGEITLRGLVLPIGGVREKVLAARQAGIQTVLLPAGNKRDLVDVPKEVRKEMKFHFLNRVDDILPIALLKEGRMPRPRARPKAAAARTRNTKA